MLGDGAINEAVNGIIGQAGAEVSGSAPQLAVIPGGGGNVFGQALGLPVDPAAAITRIGEVIKAGRFRAMGSGFASDRYFTFSAGLGMDAEVVQEVERMRPAGTARPRRCSRGRSCTGTPRVPTGAGPDAGAGRAARPSRICVTTITNRSPWTYVHGRALLPVPNPDFNSGPALHAAQMGGRNVILSSSTRATSSSRVPFNSATLSPAFSVMRSSDAASA